MSGSDDIRTVVREKYGEIADQGGTCCDEGTGCGCGCVGDTLNAIG